MDDSTMIFESSDVQSVVSNLSSGMQSLSSIAGSVSSSFMPLISCDLFVDGLNKIISNINDVKSGYDNISSIIDAHISEYVSMEDDIANMGNNYSSYGGSTDVGSLSNIDVGGDIYLGSVSFGTSISTSLDDTISQIDDNTVIKIINFIKILNNNSVSISDILKEEKTDILIQYLIKFYKDYNNVELTVEDKSKVRKQFLMKLMNSSVLVTDENNIFNYKEYLKNVAKENSCDVDDLLTDSSKKDIVTNAMQNLYDGNVDYKQYGLNSNYQSEFQSLVGSVEKRTGFSKEVLFSNPLLLV